MRYMNASNVVSLRKHAKVENKSSDARSCVLKSINPQKRGLLFCIQGVPDLLIQ